MPDLARVLAGVIALVVVAPVLPADARPMPSVQHVRVKAPPLRKAPAARPARASSLPARAARARVEAPTATVLVQYQRVGRELIKLQELRGPSSCSELWVRFRAIRIDEAVATFEARVDTIAELAELHDKIERTRGVVLSAECLNNPLASECR